MTRGRHRARASYELHQFEKCLTSFRHDRLAAIQPRPRSEIVDDGCRVQQHVFGFADPGDHVQPPCGVDVAAVVPNLDQSTLLQFDCTSHERWAPYRRFARACSHHLRKSGTASADPSCPEANTTTVAEMSASENACSFPADAS